MSEAHPGGGKAAIRPYFKRDFPDRAPASRWCGKHPKERTVLLLNARWVCRDCAVGLPPSV